MSSSWRTSKSLHVAGTIWLGLAVVCLLVFGLRQAGLHWWLIFSLSGHSVVMALLFFNVYLFAIYRSAVRNQKTDLEHPLTSTPYYMCFYGLSPFLGGLAGLVGMLGVPRLSHYLIGTALATLGGTFLVWIIVDPLIGLVEMLSPASRRHRTERLAHARAMRQKQQQDRDRLFAEIDAQDKSRKEHWRQLLTPPARRLAHLLGDPQTDPARTENEAVDIGLDAWRTGGLSCMQLLHNMVMADCPATRSRADFIDYVSLWWDGIGTWHNSPTPNL